MGTEAGVVQRCLDQIEALGAELGTATDAIVANAVCGFEESIGRQQQLIQALSSSLPAARATIKGQQGGSLDVRLDEASRNLCRLNARYAALLTHTGRSMRMLRSLYSAALDAPGTNVGERQPWSLQG